VDTLVRELRDLFGLTVVMITHDLDLLWQVADRVAVLGTAGCRPWARCRSFHNWTTPGAAFFDGPRGRSRTGCTGTGMETKLNFACRWRLCTGPGRRADCRPVVAVNRRGLFKRDYDLYWAIEDESVAGLNLNAPVKYNGVDVGKVREIDLDHTNPQRVTLLLALVHGARRSNRTPLPF
jgi:energy-coupling factor transporter ATP-binding protein EcfA2